ncbi:MAG: peptidylprolyl isomerase [Thermoplasmatales archaeon]|nr:peptidylprolyl isomerase [Thermoplasmatales archaeon]
MTSKKSQRKRSNPAKKQSAFESKGVKIGIVIIFIAIVAVAAVYLYSGSGDDGNGDGDNGVVGNPIAIIDTSMGTIKVELYEDKVPNTCENFINYANDGFYDGLVFHRVIDDFMIQGGGFYPNGTEKDTNDPIDLEINEEVRHVDGAIAMARTNDPNSATSQFFIDDGPQPNLEPGGVDPNGYAAFGVVIDGMDIVRSIAIVETTIKHDAMQNWPIDDVIINSITIENQ